MEFLKSRRLIFLSTVLLFLLLNSVCFAITASIEKIVLKGDWEEAKKILEQDNQRVHDPVARLVMAHACLINNQNNESMLLFLSVKEQKELKLWDAWTNSLLQKYPRNSIAFYLLGDAKARLGKLKEAEEIFTKAIEANGDNALIKNARGIVYILNNKKDEALMDLYQAANLAPKFADAQANLGTYWILLESSDGALEAFNKALAINPNFALAYNGIGSAYFGKGKFDQAAENFTIASKLNSILSIAEINHGFASAYASKMITLASIKKKPGTTLKSIIQQYPDALKERQSGLLKTLPDQNDHSFWKKIETFHTLSQDQLSSFVKEYGAQKVQTGAFLKMQELQGKITENNSNKIPFPNKLDFSNTVSSLAFSSFESNKKIEGWKSLINRKTDIDMGNLVGKLSNNPSTHTKFLIDIPGASWTGGTRENDWGNMLASNKMTIYIRHQGPGRDKWDTPKESNAIVVTLPHKWDKKVANAQLLPHLNSAFSQGKDLHCIVDINITKSRHVLPIPKPGEDIWAANVVDYVTKHRFSNYNKGILAGHSRGTATYHHIKDFSSFEQIFVSSPRGDDALSWIKRTPNLPSTYIITGRSDYPNWRWKERYGTLLKENSNLQIVRLQDKASRSITHSKLQNLGTEGNWRIFRGTGHSDIKGSLGELLTKNTSNKSLTYLDTPPTALLSAQYQSLTNGMNFLNNKYAYASKLQSSSQIPGFYTSTDRSLTDLSALALKGIQSAKGFSITNGRALIVAEDQFRANLLQQQLFEKGFASKIISSNINPQIEAKQWGADVILGIKKASEQAAMGERFLKGIKQNDKYPFSGGLDGGPGGGGASLPSLSHSIPLKAHNSLDKYNQIGSTGSTGLTQPKFIQNWDWGKQFTPIYPKGSPGGVSTEEIEKAFVDKGNWPVLTAFGLFYSTGGISK